MKNNQINKIKRRADTLADYIVERVERLEEENRNLREENNEFYERAKHYSIMFKEWATPCEKVLGSISKITKSPNGEIVVDINKRNRLHYDTEVPFYPLIEKLLKEYKKKVEFERLLKKVKKGVELAPITPLMKGE